MEQARNSRQVRGVPAPLLLATTCNTNSHPQLANGHGGHWAPINGSSGSSATSGRVSHREKHHLFGHLGVEMEDEEALVEEVLTSDICPNVEPTHVSGALLLAPKPQTDS